MTESPFRMVLSGSLIEALAALAEDRTVGLAAAFAATLAKSSLMAPATCAVGTGTGWLEFPVPALGERFDDLWPRIDRAPWQDLPSPGAAVLVVTAAGAGPAPAGNAGPLARSEVTLLLEQDGTRWTGEWRLAGGWAHQPVRPLADAFERVLASAVADPGRAVGDLEYLGDAALAQLARWGQRPDDEPWSPAGRLVTQLVTGQAVRIPGALAFSDGRVELTFSELDRSASAVAADLGRRGVGRGSTVGLMMPRCAEMLIGFLGVLKCGAAAALLDPAHPAWRLARVAAEVGACGLLTTAEYQVHTPDGPWVTRLDARLAPQQATFPSVELHPDDIAYVVTTSGSTGRPKLVAVTHRSIAHSIGTHQAGHCIAVADRGAWLAPPGSSASVGEIWPYLAAGASVHTVGADIASSPEELRDWLVAARITKAFVSMPMIEYLTALDWPDEVALKLMTTGGDTVRRWAPRDLPFEVAVGCGSAEANGISSCLVTWPERLTSRTATVSDRAAMPPVGRPWPGVRVRLLGRQLRRVVPGGVGELYIGGPELASGYLSDPAQTADRFVPDPYGPPGSRLYRTGDLGRFDERGILHHLGRADREIKIHGFRVSPGEVEATLLSYPGVREAVVVAVPDRSGTQRLCAYVVPAGELDVRALAAFAAARLPAHAVPVAVTKLSSLPLTPNYKIDRIGLPEPAWNSLRSEFTGPRDEVETWLAELWRELLDADDIGVDDHFFQLGGSSLTASQLLNRVRSSYGIRFTMRDLRLSPTPARLAAQLRLRQGDRIGPHGAGASTTGTGRRADDPARPFDDLGLEYEKAYGMLPEQHAAIDWLLTRLPPGATVLDIGSGTGRPTADRLTAAGHDVTGIDVSATMVELARRQVPAARFEHVDVRLMAEPSVPPDAVCAFLSLLQMPRDDLDGVLGKIAGWLAPGGYFLFATVPFDADGSDIDWLGRQIQVSSYPSQVYISLLRAAGLDIVRQRRHVFQPRFPGAAAEDHLFLYATKPLL